ncbi:MAG TPA: hypothetical protein VGK67_11525 [Myxococcales bacterium]|jgi:hypothetical protein
MLLIELATQNVKGFSPTSRAAFKPGYNVVAPPPGVQSGLLPILEALFYGDGTGTDAVLATGPQARAGLTAQGTDGRIYRLVRGLGGAGALHRLEPNKQWAVVAQENADIGRHLRQSMGVPTREAFRAVLTFDPRSLPSRRKAAEHEQERMLRPLGGPPAGSGHGGPPGRTTSGEMRAIRSNALVEAAMAAAKASPDRAHNASALRQEIEAGKALEEVQYKLEGMRQRLYQLDEMVAKLQAYKTKSEELKAALKGTHSLESLGLDVEALKAAGRYDDAFKKLKDQLGKLAQEEELALEKSGGHKVQPITADQHFLASAGAGVLTLGGGVALMSSGVGAIALLSIPAFGYASLCLLRWIGRLQQVDALGRRQSVTKDREQKLYGAFDGEFLLLKGAMKVVDVENGREFIEYMKERQKKADELSAIEQQIAEKTGGSDFDASLREQADLSAQAKELEAQVAEAGAGVNRDWHEAERELAEMESGSEAPKGLVAAGGGSFEEKKDLKPDPIPALLAASQDLFAGATVQTLGAAMRERASQYVLALTDRRYVAVEFDGKGNATLSAPGRSVPAGQLEDLDLDMLYIAVKLTIVERYAPLGKPVLIMDEPFLGFDDPKLQLLSRMLKHIATNTQVVHGSALPAHHGLADALHQA